MIKSENLFVTAGFENSTNSSNNIIVKQVKQIVRHPNFNFANLENDIALIKLSTNLSFSNTIQPISLATNDVWKEKDVSDVFETCLAIKWSDEYLYEVVLPLISNIKCANIINGVKTNRSQFCTLTNNINDGIDQDICQEESGGPLLCDTEQVFLK